jgi:hypothetical protein
MTAAVPRQVFWNGTVPLRDNFGRTIVREFIDGRTRSGQWAFMTPASHQAHGVGLGMGKGQRYEWNKAANRWLKVEG